MSKTSIASGSFHGLAERYDTQDFGIVSDGWKLIHHAARPEGAPEFELFNHADDHGIDHSNVAPPHGSAGAGSPFRLDIQMFQAKMMNEKPNSIEPAVSI